MSYTFDGVDSLIILPAATPSINVQDMYSRWKEWTLVGDNSKYAPAFTTIGGDPIGGGQSVAAYIFLNTTAGWRIRPSEANQQLAFTGNLYSVDPSLPLFVSTLGSFTVTVTIERSSSSLSVGGSTGTAGRVLR